MIGRGADPARMYAELFARTGGYNHGKGGSLHMIDTALGFLGANGIVGGGIPIAGGAALQFKRTGSDAIAVTFFGDGASNEGAFHEAVTNQICDDLVAAIAPRHATVTGKFWVRGGIATSVTVTHTKS